MLRLVLLCLLAGTLLRAGCGGDDDNGGGGGAEAAATPTATDDGSPAPLDASKTYVATVSTSMGDFEITLDPKQAPKTGGSFKSLADKGFYDNLTFHRVVPGFVIQGGDPNGDGTGGPDYSVEEAPPQDLAYTKGVVAMAKTGAEPAGTSGSQFFVVTADDAQLPPDYALLGKVTKGIGVVQAIGQLGDPADQQGTPSQTVVMQKVTLSQS
jgi:peptidyl-prolyl cis-trans isomerase B (cyclophilin B)